MPERAPRTKSEKRAAVSDVVGEFERGELHSGSKSGPKVKSKKQAVAIAMSESGQSAKQPHPRTNPGDYQGDAHGPRREPERGARDGENPVRDPRGGDGTTTRERLERGTSHQFDRPPSKPAHGYDHPQHLRVGHLRMSGHAGAHRIGARRGR